MNKDLRVKKHTKIRKYLTGTAKRPRLAVFKSNQHIYAQIIDDNIGKTVVAVSDMKETGAKIEKAYKIGRQLADKAIKAKIKAVVFDRGGFVYQGRISELARGAREGGLKF